jgi:hypothetical protein
MVSVERLSRDIIPLMISACACIAIGTDTVLLPDLPCLFAGMLLLPNRMRMRFLKLGHSLPRSKCLDIVFWPIVPMHECFLFNSF